MSRIVDQGNETSLEGQMGELINPPSSAVPAYTLPGEAWLSSATLSQDGFDLVLTLDGATHRVGDYFSFQTPPNLVLETGPSLTPSMVKSLLPRAFASDYLYAGPAAGPGLGEPIGTVSLLAGTATVRRVDGSTEVLSRGDPIYRGDVLLTGDGSFVKIRFTDGTTFQLGKNAEATLDDFEFNESANIGNFEASIRVGGFYYKSGKIGEVTEGSTVAHTKLSTPSSIISVRGSELEGTVDSSGQTSIIHRSGILVITDQNGNNPVTLDQPGETAVVMQGSVPAFYAEAPAVVIQQIQASVEPQTGGDEVAQDEPAEETQEEQEEGDASEEEEVAEASEEDAEEAADEGAADEGAGEDSEEEAQEESDEGANKSEEGDEASSEEDAADAESEAEDETANEETSEASEAESDDDIAEENGADGESAEDNAENGVSEETAEEVAEGAADESSDEGADEAVDEFSEDASQAESTDADGDEVNEEVVDEAASEEASDGAADGPADEAEAASADGSGEETTADSGEGTPDDASSDTTSDGAAEDGSNVSSEDGGDAQGEADASASEGASADETGGSTGDAASDGGASADETGGSTGDAASDGGASVDETSTAAPTNEGAGTDGPSGDESSNSDASEGPASSNESSVEGSTAPPTASSESASGESSDLTSDASSDNVSGSSAASTDSGSSENASASQASDADAAGDGTSPSSTGSEAGSDSSAGLGSATSESPTTSSGSPATSTSLANSSGAVDEVAVNTGETQDSSGAPTSTLETNTQQTVNANETTEGSSETSSSETPFQPVIEQTQEEPPPDNPPEAQPDELTIVSDEAITLDDLILANDFDVDESQSPELTAVSLPEAIGDIEVTDEGTVFVPNAGVLAGLGAGETLTETLEYTVTSGELTDTSTIEITLEGANDAPVAQDDTAATPENESITIDVTANDSDVDGDDLVITSFDAGTLQGEVTISEDGTSLVYVPPNIGSTETVTEVISYTVSDGTESAVATVTIEVSGVDDPITINTDETAFVLDLTSFDDPSVTEVEIPLEVIFAGSGLGSELTVIELDTSQTQGSVRIGSVLYSPGDAFLFLAEGETTTEQFGITVQDQFGEEASGTFVFTITGVNDAPTVTEPSAISLLEDTGAEGAVVTTVAGSDIDGDTVTYAITSGNEAGYFAINAGTGEVTLTADGATALNDDGLISTSTTIGVTVSDGTLSSSEAPLEVTFGAQNDAPTADDDATTVIAGGLVTITAANGVLANDVDVDSPISVESAVLTTPNSTASPITGAGQSIIGQYGTLTLEADGSFVYSADQIVSLQLLEGEQAVETFSVTVSDGEFTALSTLTITVDGVDDTSVFFGDNAFTVDQDVSSQIFPVQGVLSSFDVDQHAVIAPVDAGQGTYGVFGYQPSNDVDGVDGSDPVDPPPGGSAFELPFQAIRPDTPVIDQQSGTVSVDLSYEVDDPSASAPGLVLRVHYDSSVIQNPVLNSNAPGLIQLDDVEDIDNLDFDDSTDRMILVAWTSTESLDWPGTFSGPIASLSFESDFSQAQNAWTNIRFTGVAADGFVFDAQSIQVYGNSGLPEQADGTLSAGTWGYTPDPDLYRSLAHGETVTDQYTFTSSDGQLHPVSVTLVGVNDAPQYQGVYSLPMDSVGTYVFSDQDVTAFDPDDGPTDIVYTVVDAQGGSVLVGGLVVTSFTQDDVNSGRVSFVLDTSSLSVNTATPLLTLSVEDGNEDASEPELLLLNFTDPNASGLQFVEDPIVNINVDQVAVVAVLTLLSNDLSSDGGAVTISSVDTLSEFGGTVSFDGTDITYTPPSGFVGIDRVFYVITDSSGETSIASLTFEISQPPPSTKPEPMGEDLILVDFALLDDQEQPQRSGVRPETEDFYRPLVFDGPLPLASAPSGEPSGVGDNLLFGEVDSRAAQIRANDEADGLGGFVDEWGAAVVDRAAESEGVDEALIHEARPETGMTGVTDREGLGRDALSLDEAHAHASEGLLPFLSGSALVFRPELAMESHQTPSSVGRVSSTNSSDLDDMPLLSDLLTDGDEWMAAAFAAPSEVSTVTPSAPIAQNVGEHDIAILQYPLAASEVDIIAVDTAHIILT